jgi:hypothetical protein
VSRRGTDPEIKREIWRLTENNPKMSAGQILIRLRSGPLSDRLPTERTIARIKAKFLSRQPEARKPYRLASWPESMLDGSLPWESARAMWDLIAYCRRKHLEEPSIREAQWFWRVTLAAPDLGIAKRNELAVWCADAEEWPEERMHPSKFRDLESYLALSPWRSRKSRSKQEKADVRLSTTTPNRKRKGTQ